MSITGLAWLPKQVIVYTPGQVCSNTEQLLKSQAFREVVLRFISRIRRKETALYDLVAAEGCEEPLIELLRALGRLPLDEAAAQVPGADVFTKDPKMLHQFVEELYDYWRHFDRFIVCHSETPGALDAKPYRVFNDSIEQLTHLVRAAYRDICENITGDHPRIYRQVSAGAQLGVIAVTKDWPCNESLQNLKDIPFVRQILIDPPLIIDPPMNKRTGEFTKVDTNPLTGLSFTPGDWFCYPAQVGHLVVFVYFHKLFMGLGCCLANLFELASDEQIRQGPDAVYAFGVPPEAMVKYGDLPTVFYEDEANDMLVAAVPGESRFGYFGYLKKMVLTLHNIVVMKKLRRMPFHGAMLRIDLKNGAAPTTVVIIGDTGTGKSESIEALRVLGDERIREIRIIADDMGSLAADNGLIRGYGTEIGAFVRLDDLQQGYVFAQVDRAIIMSPHKTNARAVMPVTTMDEVLHGYPVDYILYANNYEDVDEEHPIIEQFASPEEALAVFRRGTAMSKGTTTSSGLVHTYFANIFGPAQYPKLHDEIAEGIFQDAFDQGIFVGQIRTRLALPGYEQQGPEAAATALLGLVTKEKPS
ncbi:MAG: phosphoenolpyruvate carboxykinase [Firmicutes bacterium]|nr:phosphoenolpyruvate carboxykinase [Bacillota bacterium]